MGREISPESFSREGRFCFELGKTANHLTVKVLQFGVSRDERLTENYKLQSLLQLREYSLVIAGFPSLSQFFHQKNRSFCLISSKRDQAPSKFQSAL